MKMKTSLKILLFYYFILLILCKIYAYDYPVREFSVQHPIHATLGEYRDTGSQDHFHTGIDIGAPDGTSVYSIEGGLARRGGNGSGAYVVVSSEARRFAYVHLTNRIYDDPNGDGRPEGVTISAHTKVGEVYFGQRHVHLTENGGASNPLRNGGIYPYTDTLSPQVHSLDFRRQGSGTQLSTSKLNGKIDILARASDAQSGNGSSNVGIYRIEYQVDKDGSTILGPICNIRFDSISGASLSLVYDTTNSNISTYYYWVTNAMNENRYWNTKLRIGQEWNGSDAKLYEEAAYKDGRYQVTVGAYDIAGNRGERSTDVVIDNFRPFVKSVSIGENYKASWVLNGNDLTLNKSANSSLKSGNHNITIQFSEPVKNVVLSIDTFGPIPLSSSGEMTYTGILTISENDSSHNGTRTMTISATDINDNQTLQISTGTTSINPNQLTRDLSGVMLGSGGTDTVHQFDIGDGPQITLENTDPKNVPVKVTYTIKDEDLLKAQLILDGISEDIAITEGQTEVSGEKEVSEKGSLSYLPWNLSGAFFL